METDVFHFFEQIFLFFPIQFASLVVCTFFLRLFVYFWRSIFHMRFFFCLLLFIPIVGRMFCYFDCTPQELANTRIQFDRLSYLGQKKKSEKKRRRNVTFYVSLLLVTNHNNNKIHLTAIIIAVIQFCIMQNVE